MLPFQAIFKCWLALFFFVGLINLVWFFICDQKKTVSFVFLHSSKLLLIMNNEEESDDENVAPTTYRSKHVIGQINNEAACLTRCCCFRSAVMFNTRCLARSQSLYIYTYASFMIASFSSEVVVTIFQMLQILCYI